MQNIIITKETLQYHLKTELCDGANRMYDDNWSAIGATPEEIKQGLVRDSQSINDYNLDSETYSNWFNFITKIEENYKVWQLQNLGNINYNRFLVRQDKKILEYSSYDEATTHVNSIKEKHKQFNRSCHEISQSNGNYHIHNGNKLEHTCNSETEAEQLIEGICIHDINNSIEVKMLGPYYAYETTMNKTILGPLVSGEDYNYYYGEMILR